VHSHPKAANLPPLLATLDATIRYDLPRRGLRPIAEVFAVGHEECWLVATNDAAATSKPQRRVLAEGTP